jgi:hypothetical protein
VASKWEFHNIGDPSSRYLRQSPVMWTMCRLPNSFPSKVVISCDFFFACVRIGYRKRIIPKDPGSHKTWIDDLEVGVPHYRFRIFMRNSPLSEAITSTELFIGL